MYREVTLIGHTSHIPAADCPMPQTEKLSALMLENYLAMETAGVKLVFRDITESQNSYDKMIATFASLGSDSYPVNVTLDLIKASLGGVTSGGDSIADVLDSFLDMSTFDLSELGDYVDAAVATVRDWVSSAKLAYDGGLPIPIPPSMPAVSLSSTGAAGIWVAAAKFLVDIAYAIFLEWLYNKFFKSDIPTEEGLERFLSEFIIRIDGRTDGMKVQVGSQQVIDAE